MNEITISEAVLGDVQPIRLLMARVIGRDVDGDEDAVAAMLENVNSNLKYWMDHSECCVQLVARSGSQVVGVILVKNFWNLCSLFVESSLQGQGLGRRLVEAAALRCKDKSEKGAIFLNAAAKAIPFYRTLGFCERESSQSLPEGFLAMARPV